MLLLNRFKVNIRLIGCDRFGFTHLEIRFLPVEIFQNKVTLIKGKNVHENTISIHSFLKNVQ